MNKLINLGDISSMKSKKKLTEEQEIHIKLLEYQKKEIEATTKKDKEKYRRYQEYLREGLPISSIKFLESCQ